jgi:hypothetical protein
LPEIRGKGDHPEKKRRFMAIDLPIIMHKGPIPPIHHLSGDLDISGFIRIPEVPSAQIQEEKNQTECDENGHLSPFLSINFS